MKEHITTELKETFIETANTLKGHERRRFMARIVRSMGRGGAAWAERELGWNRFDGPSPQKAVMSGSS